MDNGDKAKCRCCPHCEIAHVSYVRNDGEGPPVLLIENLPEVSVVTLTNQVIYINCPSCQVARRFTVLSRN